MHWALVAAGIIIAALFGTTLWQAREIGELGAEIAAAEAVAAYKAETAAASQTFNDEAAAKIKTAETTLQEVTNERDNFRAIAFQNSQESPVNFGDAFNDDLAGWMRCVASDNRSTCRLHPPSPDEAGRVDPGGGNQ